ncbi:glycosyltransferase family protein [Desulfolithobacter sp.]
MKLLVYCQHVLGIGHLCRTLEILERLSGHKVILVLGGPPVAVEIPPHVRSVQLPGLKMDPGFSGLQPVEPQADLAQVKEERVRLLLDLFSAEKPDILLVELYPFGRKGFRFELEPLLAMAKQSGCFTASSVRDILVEKDQAEKFETRVVRQLNRYFDLLLIHGDEQVIRLDETFSRMEDIRIPVRYTGYICHPPAEDDRARLRRKLGLPDEELLVVASAGGGSVGAELLQAATLAHNFLDLPIRMQIFTGPYMPEAQVTRLRQEASLVTRPQVPFGRERLRLSLFTDIFPAWLAAADLSISMGGYNTTMNVVAAGTPALIHPFAQNREQRLRAERLLPLACLEIVDRHDLQPERLAARIYQMLGRQRIRPTIRLDGAREAAQTLISKGACP